MDTNDIITLLTERRDALRLEADRLDAAVRALTGDATAPRPATPTQFAAALAGFGAA